MRPRSYLATGDFFVLVYEKMESTLDISSNYATMMESALSINEKTHSEEI